MLTDGLLSTLVNADIDLAALYAACRAKHAAAVAAYDETRAKLSAANKEKPE